MEDDPVEVTLTITKAKKKGGPVSSVRMNKFPGFESEMVDLGSGHKDTEKTDCNNGIKVSFDGDTKDKRDSGKPKGFQECWSTFMMETSCHGMKILATPTISKTVRVIYGLIILTMFISLYTTVMELSSEALKYKTVTRTMVYTDNNMSFPSITLCNLCPFSFRHKDKNDPLYHLLAKLSFYGELLPEPDLESYSYQKLMNRTVTDIFDEYSMDIGLQYADYDGIILNSSHFEPLDTVNGRCYQFNGPRYISTYGSWRFTRTGKGNGLRAILKINQEDYGLAEDGTAGFRVYISHPKESPPIHKHGIEIMPGASTLMAINIQKIASLPSPYKSYSSGYCVDMDEISPEFIAKMVNATFYSFAMCQEQCVAYKSSTACSCYTPSLVIPGLKPCTTHTFLYGCYKNVSERIMMEVDTQCDCPRPCTETSYDVTLSSSQHLSTGALMAGVYLGYFNETDTAKVRDNYLEVRVYIASPLVRLEKHDPAYTVSYFFGSLGGQMGICLGASIITLVELLDVMLRTLVIGCRKMIAFLYPELRRSSKHI